MRRRPRVARLRDAAARRLGAGRPLARRQPEIGHELARVGEAMEVADLRDQSDGRDRGDAAQGLNGGDDLRQRPGGQQLLHLPGQPVAARLRLVHRLHKLLEGDLPRRMFEALSREPKAMLARPMLAVGIDASVPQKEAQHLLTRTPQRLHRRLPGAAEIAHGFMCVVRNPNRRQLARAEQRGLRHGVAAVGLHPVARPRGNQRGRDHNAFMAEHRDLPIEPVAARPGFIAERQLAMLLREPLHHLGDGFRAAWDLAKEPRFPASPAFGDRHRNRLLVRIHRHESCRKLVHGSFPMHEALTDSSVNPRCCMPRNGPPKMDIASHRPAGAYAEQGRSRLKGASGALHFLSKSVHQLFQSLPVAQASASSRCGSRATAALNGTSLLRKFQAADFRDFGCFDAQKRSHVN